MEEEFSNHSNNESFEEVLNSYMSRRQMIVGGLAGAALSFMGGSKVSALTSNAPQVAAAAKKAKIGFTSIPLQLGAMPTIAPEYDYSVLIPWREKLDGSGKSFDYAGFTAEDQAKSIGIGHDGISYFGDNKKGMLCINHEYGTTPHIMGKAVPASLDDVKLSQTAHGVSVVMIENIAFCQWAQHVQRCCDLGLRHGCWTLSSLFPAFPLLCLAHAIIVCSQSYLKLFQPSFHTPPSLFPLLLITLFHPFPVAHEYD